MKCKITHITLEHQNILRNLTENRIDLVSLIAQKIKEIINLESKVCSFSKEVVKGYQLDQPINFSANN